MALRDRLRRLQRDVRGDRDYLDLEDGTRHYFEPGEVAAALFVERMDALRTLAGTDLSEGETTQEEEEHDHVHNPPLIREALAQATPNSLRRFSNRYGNAEQEAGVVHRNGTVDVVRVGLDGARTYETLTGEEAVRFVEDGRSV